MNQKIIEQSPLYKLLPDDLKKEYENLVEGSHQFTYKLLSQLQEYESKYFDKILSEIDKRGIKDKELRGHAAMERYDICLRVIQTLAQSYMHTSLKAIPHGSVTQKEQDALIKEWCSGFKEIERLLKITMKMWKKEYGYK